MRRIRRVLMTLGLLAVAAGGLYVGNLLRTQPERPEAAALVDRVREIARLQTLEVRLSKVVHHAPDPKPAPTLAGDLLTWAVWSMKPPEGRAIVSGVARLGIDLTRFDASAITIEKDLVTLRLPPVITEVDLDLERTEIVRSNLDSAQTAELFEKGRRALAAEISWNKPLEQRARASVEKALRQWLTGVGFREVRFVDEASGAELAS